MLYSVNVAKVRVLSPEQEEETTKYRTKKWADLLGKKVQLILGGETFSLTPLPHHYITPPPYTIQQTCKMFIFMRILFKNHSLAKHPSKPQFLVFRMKHTSSFLFCQFQM